MELLSEVPSTVATLSCWMGGFYVPRMKATYQSILVASQTLALRPLSWLLPLRAWLSALSMSSVGMLMEDEVIWVAAGSRGAIEPII